MEAAGSEDDGQLEIFPNQDAVFKQRKLNETWRNYSTHVYILPSKRTYHFNVALWRRMSDGLDWDPVEH